MLSSVERARSISPEKKQLQLQQAETPTSALRNNNSNIIAADGLHTPSSTTAAFGSPSPLAPIGSATIDTMAHNDHPPRPLGEVPEFKGFGSIKRGSAPSSPRRTADTAETAPKPSPSDAMPSRSNTMKWQQRPRPGGSRPMSMAASSHSREASTDEPKGPREQPASRAPTSRPMSMAAPTHSRDASVDEPQLSRDQIAASLGARDPAYFRQTADRGLGNAAFRKSKDEMSNGDDVFTARRGLPGMSRETSLNDGRTTSPAPESVTSDTPSRFSSIREDRAFTVKAPESVTSDTPSRFGSIREDSAFSVRSSGTPSVSDGKQSSDLPFRSASNRSSATTDTNEPSGLNRTPTMSASQARLENATGRPPSPTKGMGGFVQSALMKRSDSQNKRWSAQPVGGLNRQDSSASARSGFGGLQGSYSMPKLDPVEANSRESSHEPNSRPSSSSSNLAGLATRLQDADTSKPGMPSRHHSRSKSVASTYSTTAELDGGLKSPMGSPSKRFSPNKSSWIESALARPDSPKLTPAKPAQPSWMENIARAKAQRTSADVVPTLGSPNPNDRSRPGSPTKETPFGPALLKRSDSRDLRSNVEGGSTRSITPPTKAKPSSLSSRPTSVLTQESLQLSEKMSTPTTRDETSNFRLETTAKRASEKSEPDAKPAPLSFKKSPVLNSEKADVDPVPEKKEQSEAVKNTVDNSKTAKSPPTTKPKPDTIKERPELEKKLAATDTTMSPPLPSSKPSIAPKPETTTQPTTDFRSTLRSRPLSKPSTQEQPEFLSKFGSLRKAQQEKYVAPDVLKDNITRGKRGLTITDGPQKLERKDELRDSLLAKKEQWKQEKDAGITHERKISGPPVTPGKPEALGARELLGRNKSVKGASRSPEKTRNITPEALRFQKSIREKPKVEAPSAAEEPKAVIAPSPLTRSSPPTEAVAEPARRLPSPQAKEELTEPLGRTNSQPQPDERMKSPPVEERSNTYPPVAAAAPTSKLAARFNPGLAGILARGPPGSGGSPSGSRSESPAGVEASSRPVPAASSEPPAEGAPLADVRKGRAKGPKKRKGGATSQPTASAEPDVPKKAEESTSVSNVHSPALDTPASPPPATKPSPAIRPGARFGGAGPRPGATSSASIMAASLGATQPQAPAGPRERIISPASKSSPFAKPTVSPKPSLTGFQSAQDSPTPPLKSISLSKRTLSDKSATTPKDEVPEFKGFGSRFGRQPASAPEEDKENSPSVKDAASAWGRKKTYAATGSPSQIQLPTRKDEEAAMRSASLLASSPARSPSRPDSSHGLGISSPVASPSPALPPKPAKSSRIVSGQLREASPNKGKESPSFR